MMTTAHKEQTTEVLIRPASLQDLQRIVLIEHESFPTPWSLKMLRQEIQDERTLYLIAEVGGEVVGYAGMGIAADEGHIATIAVAAAHRGKGIGEALMLALLQRAVDRGVSRVVLEYRVSNAPAAALYRKLGFHAARVRRGYYQDTNEDAIEAHLDDVATPDRQQHLARLIQIWESRYGRMLQR